METFFKLLVWIVIIAFIINFFKKRKAKKAFQAEIARKRALLKHVDSEEPQVIDEYYSKIVNRDYSAFQDICNKNSELMGNFAKNVLELNYDRYMFIMLCKQLKHVPDTISCPDGQEFDFSEYNLDIVLKNCIQSGELVKLNEKLPIALFSDICCYSSNEDKQKTIDALTKLASKDKLTSGDIPAWPQKIFGQSVYYEIFKKDKLNTINLNKVEVVEFVMNEPEYYEHLTNFGEAIFLLSPIQEFVKEHFYHYIKLLDDIVKTKKDYPQFNKEQKNIFAICALLFRLIGDLRAVQLIDRDYDAPNNGFERSAIPDFQITFSNIANALTTIGNADYQDAKGEAKAQIMPCQTWLEQEALKVKEQIELCNKALIKLGEKELSFFDAHDDVLRTIIDAKFDAQLCKEANSKYGKMKKVISELTDTDNSVLAWYKDGRRHLLADVGFCSAHKVFIDDNSLIFGTNYKDISECQWPTKVIGASAYNKLFHADKLDELYFDQQEYEEFLASVNETLDNLKKVQELANKYYHALSEMEPLYLNLCFGVYAFNSPKNKESFEQIIEYIGNCYHAFEKVELFEKGCFIQNLPNQNAWGCQYLNIDKVKKLLIAKKIIISLLERYLPEGTQPAVEAQPEEAKAQVAKQQKAIEHHEQSTARDNNAVVAQLDANKSPQELVQEYSKYCEPLKAAIKELDYVLESYAYDSMKVYYNAALFSQYCKQLKDLPNYYVFKRGTFKFNNLYNDDFIEAAKQVWKYYDSDLKISYANMAALELGDIRNAIEHRKEQLDKGGELDYLYDCQWAKIIIGCDAYKALYGSEDEQQSVALSTYENIKNNYQSYIQALNELKEKLEPKTKYLHLYSFMFQEVVDILKRKLNNKEKWSDLSFEDSIAFFVGIVLFDMSSFAYAYLFKCAIMDVENHYEFGVNNINDTHMNLDVDKFVAGLNIVDGDDSRIDYDISKLEERYDRLLKVLKEYQQSDFLKIARDPDHPLLGLTNMAYNCALMTNYLKFLAKWVNKKDGYPVPSEKDVDEEIKMLDRFAYYDSYAFDSEMWDIFEERREFLRFL